MISSSVRCLGQSIYHSGRRKRPDMIASAAGVYLWNEDYNTLVRNGTQQEKRLPYRRAGE